MDIRTSTITIGATSGKMPAYFCEPAGDGPHPGVVLLMEAYGVTDHVKETAREIASAGYIVVAPDLYYREGPNKTYRYEDRQDAMDAMNALPIPTAVQDAKAAFDFLSAHPRVEGVAAVGQCFGGALLIPFSAACGDRLLAGASFYGHCDGPWTEGIENVTAPLMFFFGNQDPVVSSADVTNLEARMRALGKTFEIRRYQNAGHAYLNPRRREYNETAARASLVDLKAFLAQHVRAAKRAKVAVA